MTQPRVAILGLGIMGSGMAGRLLAAGFPLSVYNRNRDKAQPLGDGGAHIAGTPAEAASRAEIVISMLADDVASREIWLGENGALEGAAAGTVLVESSTVSGLWIRQLATAAAERKCDLLDAPVTGSKAQAAAGELVFLVGGPERALEIATPVLNVLGNRIVHFGGSGSGSTMKLINNFMSGVQGAALAEAIAFIDASGLSREKALSILVNGAPGSPIVKTLSTRAAAGDFTPNFVLRLMAKDLSYAIKEGSAHHVDLRTAAAALAIFKQAIAAGYGEKDFSAVIEATANGAKKLAS